MGIERDERAADPALSDTLHHDSGRREALAAGFGETLAPAASVEASLVATVSAGSRGASAPGAPPTSATLVARTTTVLPRATRDGALADPAARPRYLATELLGAGGMGEVVLARDHDIDRQVAIKRLHAEVADADATLRFAEEVRAVGALEHPGIVPVYDVGVDAEGRHFFVMKYLAGETLEVIIDKLAAGDPAYTKRYTFELRVQIFLQILNAVAYAHERGVIHRDIKPANVMVGPLGEVVVTDWGIAKRIRPEGAPRPPRRNPLTAEGRPPRPDMPLLTPSAIRCLLFGPSERPTMAGGAEAEPVIAAPASPRGLTREGALIGTPLYMSPEQARGGALDERSDIYSLSVLLAELLSGRHYLRDVTSVPDVLEILRGDNYGWIYERVLSDGALALSPHEFIHVALLGMIRDPDRRWERVEDMIDTLERALSGDIYVCCPFTLTKHVTNRVTDWVEGNPRAVTLLVLATPVLLLAGLATLLARALAG